MAYLMNRHLVCFPSIVFNFNYIRKTDIFFKTGFLGKYSDVNLVLRLARLGHLWYSLPSFGYRIHDEQDSMLGLQKDNSEVLCFYYSLKIFLPN